MDKSSGIVGRSYEFGVGIVRLCLGLPRNAVGFAVTDQLVRSGTSIGANVEEAQDAMSRADFLKCMNIALKEAREARYWLRIVEDSRLTDQKNLLGILDESLQLVRILTRIVKSTRDNKNAT